MALSVQEILDLNLPISTFVDNPTLAAPIRSDFDFTRSTKGTVFGPNGDFATKSAGVPRIIGGHNALGHQGLLLEGQVDQVLSAPADVTASAWDSYQMTKNGGAGTMFGKSYGEFREENVSGPHSFKNNSFATSRGTNCYLDCLVRPQGRDSIKIKLSTRDSNNNNAGAPQVSFQFSDQTTNIIQEYTHAAVRGPSIEKLPNTSFYRVGFGVDYVSGYYGFNKNFSVGNGHGSYTYTGDTSKGMDLVVANVKEGGSSESSFVFGRRVRNADYPHGSISKEDWNDSEGTWYIDFIQRPHYVHGFPRIYSYGNAELWYSLDGNNRVNYRSFNSTADQIGGNVKHDAGNYRVKIATSFKKENNKRGLSINGQHDEDRTGLAGNDAFLSRPTDSTPVRFTDPSRQGSRILLEARYIPSWLSIDERNVLTA
jgi:hypothetical protein